MQPIQELKEMNESDQVKFNSYWNILSNEKKFITLKYLFVLKTAQKHDLQNYIEPIRFINSGVDIFRLPDFLFRANAERVNALASHFSDSSVKLMAIKSVGKNFRNN